MREGTIHRQTKETEIECRLALDGSGQSDVATGIGMLDHMLEQLAKHGALDLTLHAKGDLERDAHHTVEDVGLTLGKALDQALGDRAGITRMAHALVPLDESLIQVAIDLSGRPYAAIELTFPGTMMGELPTQLVAHCLESFAQEGRLALHVRQIRGDNDHHIAEATFKALARALSDAVTLDPRAPSVPSTKDTLTS